jgi:hypothetical protein
MTDETPQREDGTTRGQNEQGGPDAKSEWWLDRPSSVNLIIKVLIVACVLSVLADFFYHKHADYSFQEWIAFDAVFGFLAYVGLITVAKGFRRLVMRDEDYYD